MTGSLELFKALNDIAGRHGVGRIDIVESRFIGLKSRGAYDSPALTVLRLAHIDIEGMTVDSKVKQIMAWIGNEWSQCLYNGILSRILLCESIGTDMARHVLLP